MLEFILFYLGIGVVVNWGISIYVMATNPNVEIDVKSAVIMLPAWPLIIYRIINDIIGEKK